MADLTYIRPQRDPGPVTGAKLGRVFVDELPLPELVSASSAETTFFAVGIWKVSVNGNLLRLSQPEGVHPNLLPMCPEWTLIYGAGDGVRTGDVQLGKE